MTSTRDIPLATRLGETVEQVREIAPAELFAVFGAEQRRLARTDDGSGRIAVGDALPLAKLTDATGRPVTVPGGRPAVIVFYRGAWCPYCNVALATYQNELLPALREHGVDLVAISPQGPDGSMTITEKNALSFPVLTDSGGDYARRLGLGFDLTDDVKAAQLAFGNDFADINSRGEWSLPKPTVIVVDARGIVRFVDVRPDYTERTEPAAVLTVVGEWA